MDKVAKLLTVISTLSAIVIEELAKERARTNMTDEELLAQAGIQTHDNEAAIAAAISAAKAERG